MNEKHIIEVFKKNHPNQYKQLKDSLGEPLANAIVMFSHNFGDLNSVNITYVKPVSASISTFPWRSELNNLVDSKQQGNADYEQKIQVNQQLKEYKKQIDTLLGIFGQTHSKDVEQKLKILSNKVNWIEKEFMI